MNPNNPNFRKTFGALLKELRTSRELTQTELAKLAGMQPSHISLFETGTREPTLNNLRRLTKALNTSADYLLGLLDE